MVRRSSATVVSGVSRIPFDRSSPDRRLAWRCRSSTMVRYGMTVRKREDEVFPNAAGIDIGASSHWVAVHRHLADSAGCDPVRQVGAMTVDLQALAAWLVSLGV
ncbi:MAG: IS110 family transposase, partial [Betaproteobacteria bacterium]